MPQTIKLRTSGDEFKTHAILMIWFLFIIIIVGAGSGFIVYRLEESKLNGWKQAMKEHPPVIMNGEHCQNITNNGVSKTHWGINLLPPCIGKCQ